MAPEKKGSASTGKPARRRASMADSATLEEQCHQKKIFVGGLAHKTTTQNIRDHFVKYGEIVDAVVLRWPDGRSRGFGYITFAEVAAATAALRVAHKVNSRDVDVKRAVPGTNKLFVGGLPQNTSAMELRKHFEQFGVVSDAVVMMDPATNRSRGFGFICYLPGQDGAAAVASALQDYSNHRIRGKWIEVKGAAPPHKLNSECHTQASRGSMTAEPSEVGPDAVEEIAAPPGLAMQQAPVEAPPGLGEPVVLDCFAPLSAQAPPPGLLWQPTKQQPWSTGFPVAPREEAPLPSLLAGGGAYARKMEPVKVKINDAVSQASPDSRSTFDASDELRRSLEQLLKLHSAQSAAATHVVDPSMWSAGVTDMEEKAVKLEC